MRKIFVQHDVNGIEGLCIVQPKVFVDNRGYLMEVYNSREFQEAGLCMKFVQDNEAHSIKGTLRGMHVNLNNPQGKLIRVLSGAIYDVVVDLRPSSKTYKQWYGIELSFDNKKQLYIPEGMGHGYLALTETDVLFKVTTHYIAGDEMGFAWNSKGLNIKWPDLGIDYIMNLYDAQNIDLDKMIFRSE